MTTDRTVAKIGRSMKNREIMAGALSVPLACSGLAATPASSGTAGAGVGAASRSWPSVGIGTRSGVIGMRSRTCKIRR